MNITTRRFRVMSDKTAQLSASEDIPKYRRMNGIRIRQQSIESGIHCGPEVKSPAFGDSRAVRHVAENAPAHDPIT